MIGPLSESLAVALRRASSRLDPPPTPIVSIAVHVAVLGTWVALFLLAFGRGGIVAWFGGFKDALDNYQVVAFSVILIAAMLGLSVFRTKLKDVRFPSWIPAGAPLQPRRVSGD